MRHHRVLTGQGAGLLVAGMLVVAVVAAGCAASRPNGTDEAPGSGGAPVTSLAPEGVGVLRVLASRGLSPAFDEIRVEFEQRNPRLSVVVSYGDGQSLTTQQGDVIASDDAAALKGLAGAESMGRLTVAPLEQAANPEAAEIFLNYLKEGSAQRILTDTGVLRP